jgi:gluconolactonase
MQNHESRPRPIGRRTFAAALAAPLFSPGGVRAQQAGGRSAPQGPAPRDWSGAQPAPYPDPDVVVLDRRFARYRVGNTPLQRLYTGTLWAEGVAWNGVGRYLVWSDIPNNRQLRWLEEDGHVSVFRKPSNYSNGNTFDFEGRQLSCEHGARRVVRYEPNGTVTVIAEKWNGKPLNSPNDIVVHPDGSIWFTDPLYGIMGITKASRPNPN